MKNKWLEYFYIRRSKLFDFYYYLKEYKDVMYSDIDPLIHFIEYGWKEGRNPSSSFDTSFYLSNNPDVQRSAVNPLFHYIRHGKKEGRKPRSNSEFPGNSLNSNKSRDKRWKKILTAQNIKKSINFIKRYGVRSFYLKAKVVIFPETQYHNLKLNKAEINIYSTKQLLDFKVPPNLLNLFPEGISIIIPTKNAGEEFEFLLKNLTNQEGFSSIEIIIVDSGSTDRTVDLARNYHAKVIEIPSEKFTHSYSRSLGAESATNDLLFFTVQDALPPDKLFLYELATVLRFNKVSAVSCAETPRQNADLFYKVICWNHYNFLGVNENDRIFSLPQLKDHVSLRRNAQLSDLACMISKNVFMQYKTGLNYAEDLGLGINLIKAGHKIAFLGSTRIIHSHNRSAYYFLKRGYVDNLFLSDMFSDFKIPKINYMELVPEIKEAFFKIINFIENDMKIIQSPLYLEDFDKIIVKFLRNFNSNDNNKRIEDISTIYVDGDLKSILIELFTQSPLINNLDRKNNFIIPSLEGITNVMTNYIRSSYEFIDSFLLEEIKHALVKQFAIVVGSSLAYAYRNRNEIDETLLTPLDQKLRGGV